MKEPPADPPTRLSYRGDSSLLCGAFLLGRFDLAIPGRRLVRREVRSYQSRSARGHSSGSVFRRWCTLYPRFNVHEDVLGSHCSTAV